MRIFLAIMMVFVGGAGFAQPMKFTLEGLGTDTVFLARYFGPKLYYADTAISKAGVAMFDGTKHVGGLMAVVTKKGQYFDFIHDKEEIDMKTDSLNNMTAYMQVRKSENNKAFYDYVKYMKKHRDKLTPFQKEYETVRDGSKRQEELKLLMKECDDSVINYQKKLIVKYTGFFVSDMVKMSMDIDLPEPPKDENGVITDSNYVYQYYVNHYWDNFNLKDARIVNTPIYQQRLDKYFSTRGVLQIPDSIFKYAQLLIAKIDWANKENKVFQYTVHHITNKYESSNIMGMDRVFVLMARHYYCEPNAHAHWISEEIKKKICDRMKKLEKTMVGEYAPVVILPDTTQKKWYNTSMIDAEYTILYFWDPNCGHCKKVTPKLQTLYERKWKARNIEVVAIGKATGDDFEAWKKFIRENNLTFMNIGLTKDVYDQAMEDPRPLLEKTTLESLNYSDTWDIFSTPRVFVLDKDKIIRFKQLSMSQLEDIMDKLTGHADDAKLFPIEDEPIDEKPEE